MEPDDLLCSRNTRTRKALARDNGTSWRASGWAGEKVARRGRSIRPHPWERTSELGGIIYSLVRRPHVDQHGALPGTRNEQAWREHYKNVLFDARIRGSTSPPFKG